MNKIKPGTRIRFLRDLESCADEDGPGNVYAKKGGLGTVALQAGLNEPHGTWEGYWVFWDHWATAAFGCEAKDFEVLVDEPLRTIHYKSSPYTRLCNSKTNEPTTNNIALCTCLDCLTRNIHMPHQHASTYDMIQYRIDELKLLT